MAFDKIVGVDGTTYNLPDAVRTKISSNITTAGQQENTAVAQVVAAGITGKANTVHTHTVSQITDLTGIGSIPGVEIGVVGGNGIALQDKHTLVYEGSTSKWRNKVASGGVTVGDTRPASPIPGDAWFDSNDGTLYVYYQDANTAQWVQVQANSALEGTILSRLGAVESRATALEAVPDYSPNYIINGGMEIWQRGTSFAPISNAAYSADRWQAQSSVAPGSRTIQQIALDGSVPGLGQIQYSLRSTVNTIGSGTNVRLRHSVEDVDTLAGKTVTLSWYGKHSTAASLRVLVGQQFGTGGSAGINISDTTANYTTSWQRFSVTFSVPSVTGKTITSDSHIRVEFFQQDATGSILEITGVQLEEGSVATPFRRAGLTIQGELAACQRYYYRQFGTQNYSPFALGYGYSTAGAECYVNFPVVMRTAPTSIETSAMSTFLVADGVGSVSTPTSIALFVADNAPHMVGLNVIKAGSFTAYRPYAVLSNNNTSSYIGYIAEL